MKNKTVLITGASKGIGFALSLKMLSEGYFVIGTSRTGVIQSVAHENFLPIALDITRTESINKAHQLLLDRFDTIDSIINNAGIGTDLNQLTPDQDSFDSTFAVNVRGVVFFTEPLLDLLSKKGSIIMISSKMGSVVTCVAPDSVAYMMSKSAINMYTKILANRFSDHYRVAAVHPGYVKTAISETAKVHGRLTPEQSAENIFTFLESDFRTGVFWDSESGTELTW